VAPRGLVVDRVGYNSGSVTCRLEVLLGGLIAAVLVVATACGDLDDEGEATAPLFVEPAPTEVARLDLEIPLDETGFFEFDSWPNACDLLTDPEIMAVLPQVQAIEHTPLDQDITIIAADRTVTAANARCGYVLDIPEAGLGMDRAVPPTIWVEVEAAGTPEVVELNYLPGDDSPITVPSGQCHAGDVPFDIQCQKGPLAFRISSQFQHQQIDGNAWTDRYRVGDETRTFTADSGGTDTDDRSEGARFRRDTLYVEVAKIILSKL
jgi:hypothetical protein